MHIRCPNCSATYEISAATSVVGRKVRCTRCTHVWRAEPLDGDAPSTTTASAAEPAAAPPPRAAAPPPPPPPPPPVRASEQAVAAHDSVADTAFETDDTPRERSGSPGGAHRDEAPAASAADHDDEGGGEEDAHHDPRHELNGHLNGAGSHRHEFEAGAPRRTAPARPSASETTIGERRAELDPGILQGRAGGASATAFEDEFWQDTPASRARAPAAPVPDVTQARRRAAPAPQVATYGEQERRGSAGTAIGWVALLLVLAGLAGVFALRPIDVARTLPGTAELYASLGMPLNLRGLEFRNVSTTWTVDGRGRPALDIAGEIENVTTEPVKVPTVVFALKDEDGQELFNWATPVRRSALPAGKSSKFQARIPAPPDAVRGLQVRFSKGT